MTRTPIALALLCGLMAAPAAAQTADPATVEAFVARTWAGSSPEWRARVEQDETQKQCTAARNEPDNAAFQAILAREKASVVFPADGNVMGDWRRGQQLAQRGTGGQFTDRPDTPRGGNCYACHQLSRAELSFGTLGPSLTGYGRDRKFDPAEARNAYAKIFNAMSVLPCSQMPRFGFHKFLSEQQIKDAVAYLFDPESPVNK